VRKPKRGKRKPGRPVHDDRACRDFTSEGPHELWLADITEHDTRDGTPYVCAMRDVFSNRNGGYPIDSQMKSILAVDALQAAV
jgi:transposase InsO family protein